MKGLTIKEELKDLKKRGVRTVILNNWREGINYTLGLANDLKRVERGVYETNDLVL